MLRTRATRTLMLIGFIVFSTPCLTWATSAQMWVMRTKNDFADARLDDASITPEGGIVLSPSVTRLAESPEPFLWCVGVDPRGAVYVGGGNDGQVFRLGSSGMEIVFDAPEVEVHALAFDATGRLFVGTSPDGRIYRVSKDKSGEVFFEPRAKYVWAIAFDGAGNLYVATGQPGRIYRVASSGKSEILLDGREDHIRSLISDGHGGFYAGSDPGGIVYHLSPDGKATVLYDSPAHEISSLAVMDGDLYAATLSPLQRGRPAGEARAPVTRVRVTAEGGGEVQDEGEPSGDQSSPPPRPQSVDTFSGAVYRISSQGYARKIWESHDSLPLSLLSLPGGRLLVGTGDKGRLLVLASNGDASDVTSLEASQVNALAAGPEGSTLAATSNLGALFKVNAGFAKVGSVTSGAKDAGFVSRWGALSWDAQTPANTEIAFEVRTGDTEEPDGSWSPWSKPYSNPESALIEQPEARYLQWRATLRSKGDSTPVLKSIQVHYMPRNMPPEIESVDIMNPGVSLQPTGGGSSTGDDSGEAPPRRPSQPKRSFQKGMRSVAWKATDANGDPLRTEVQYRGEDETQWKTMETGVEDDFYSWDSTAMPDGVYRIRIIVSDAGANPPGKGFTGQRESSPFEVDNTPPVVSDLKARLNGRSAEISVAVTDSFSVVGETAYSIDAGDWTLVVPEDGIADSTREAYRFTTKELSQGEHSVVVRARDRAGNVSAGKVIVRVP